MKLLKIKAERGFTLIEMLVVVIVIGILVAVALPLFLGKKSEADKIAAKHHLAVAYRVASDLAASNPDGSNNFLSASALATAIDASKPGFPVATSTSPGGVLVPGTVYVVESGTAGKDLLLQARSNSQLTYTLTVTNRGKPVEGTTSVTYASNVLADNPNAFWRLNNISGTTATDSKGTNHGTYSGTAGTYTFGQPSLIPTSTDYSTSFSGTGAAIAVPGNTSAMTPSTGLTLEAWVTTGPAPPGQAHDIINKANGFLIRDSSSNTLRFDVFTGSGPTPNDSYIIAPYTLQPNTTYYLACTYDPTIPSTAIKCYANGSLVGSGPTVGTPANIYTGSTSPVYIGSNAPSPGPLYWQGAIDEVAIYGYPLTASQISTHYALGQSLS